MTSNKFFNWIRLQKEGIIFGSIVGAVAYFIFAHGNPSLMAIESPSMLDKVVELGIKWKWLIAFIIVGSGIGAIVDMIKKPGR